MPVVVKERRNLKREFEEQQRLNALANRENLLQQLREADLLQEATLFFRGGFNVPSDPPNKLKRYWLGPWETMDDLIDPAKVECCLKNIGWFKKQFAMMEKDEMPI